MKELNRLQTQLKVGSYYLSRNGVVGEVIEESKAHEDSIYPFTVAFDGLMDNVSISKYGEVWENERDGCDLVIEIDRIKNPEYFI